MKQKTAVDTLVEDLIKLGYLHSKEYGQSPRVKKAIKQAKKLEKQQMIDFAKKCQTIFDVDFDGNVEFAFKPEESFTETFNP